MTKKGRVAERMKRFLSISNILVASDTNLNSSSFQEASVLKYISPQNSLLFPLRYDFYFSPGDEVWFPGRFSLNGQHGFIAWPLQ